MEATESNLLHELAKVSDNYEAKMDKQNSIAMRTQKLLEVKLREELSQLGYAHDSKHQDQAMKFKSSTEVLQVIPLKEIGRVSKDNGEKHNRAHSLTQAGGRICVKRFHRLFARPMHITRRAEFEKTGYREFGFEDQGRDSASEPKIFL